MLRIYRSARSTLLSAGRLQTAKSYARVRQDEGRRAQEAAAERRIITSQPACSSQPPPSHGSSARRTQTPRPAYHEASHRQRWRLKHTCLPLHPTRKLKPDISLGLVSFLPTSGEERAVKQLRKNSRGEAVGSVAITLRLPWTCRMRQGCRGACSGVLHRKKSRAEEAEGLLSLRYAWALQLRLRSNSAPRQKGT